jgi:2'-5' RNA ligase
MARLSVAVRPPREVAGLLAALERPALPGVRWSVPEQWLVKLRPLGHVDERLVPVTHPQPFQADLVLARGRVPRELAGRPVAGSWTTRSVSLVADRSAPGMPRFEHLADFPLEGPGPG